VPLILLSALLVFAVGSAQATLGALDPSFGSGGKVATAFGSSNTSKVAAVAVQPDGKIVAVGYTYDGTRDRFALARYNADGSLDAGFGTSGKVTTSFGANTDDDAHAVALQPDGKIVVAGTSFDNDSGQNSFALARYNADGSLDTNFGSGGLVTTSFGSVNADYGYAVALQPDGKIVVAGADCITCSDHDFALARYNADGSLDASFSTSGKVTTSFGANTDDLAYAVALQTDGKIVAVGQSFDGSHWHFALARYKADGSADSDFGKVTTPIGSDAYASAAALQPDGKIVVAGSSSTGTNYDFALARYNADGSLDSGFGTAGKILTDFGSAHDFGYGVALQPDGKIVAVGSSEVASSESNSLVNEFAVARYNADGSLDAGFGSNGKVTTAFGAADDVANAAAIDPHGRIVAVGYTDGGSHLDFALARYLGSTLTVTKAGSGTGTVTSSPAGIDCGATCSAPFAAVSVTLTAAPTASSRFGGWSGGGCSGTGTCTVTLDAAVSVTATFVARPTLTLARGGSGSGAVTSSPAGIDCGRTCTSQYDQGASVTLTATAAAGSTFAGWSGACTGASTCTLTLDSDKSMTATFESDKTLTVAKAGTGAGTVTSSSAGIDCGAVCSHAYSYGTAVTLTAIPQAKSAFKGWSGDCSGTGVCTVTMSAAHSATATFQPLCIVPNVKGKTLVAAKTAIRKAHCSIGKVTSAFSSKVKKGRVISQTPNAGARRAAGTKVNLKVSKGKKT
jgi:uncharacterized delta-60 repeat protein